MRFILFFFFVCQFSALFAVLTNDDASKQAVIAALHHGSVVDVDIQRTHYTGKYCSAIYFIHLKDASGAIFQTVVAKEFAENDAGFITEKQRYGVLAYFLKKSYDNQNSQLPYLVAYLGSCIYGQQGVLFFEKARGVRLLDYLTVLLTVDELVLQTQIQQIIAPLFYFQKHFWNQNKNFYHGDLHAKNIFYDPKTGRVSWIDYENMALCLTPSKPLCDDYNYFDADLKKTLDVAIAFLIEKGEGKYDQGALNTRKWLIIPKIRQAYYDLLNAHKKAQQDGTQKLFEAQ